MVEAKSDELSVSEGVMQAKDYAQKLQLETTYSTNGNEIYQICMKTGEEGLVNDFLTPQQLWNKTLSDQNEWREKFANVPFENRGGSWQPRYYQEIAVQKAIEAIAQGKDRILLTLETAVTLRWDSVLNGKDYLVEYRKIDNEKWIEHSDYTGTTEKVAVIDVLNPGQYEYGILYPHQGGYDHTRLW